MPCRTTKYRDLRHQIDLELSLIANGQGPILDEGQNEQDDQDMEPEAFYPLDHTDGDDPLDRNADGEDEIDYCNDFSFLRVDDWDPANNFDPRPYLFKTPIEPDDPDIANAIRAKKVFKDALGKESAAAAIDIDELELSHQQHLQSEYFRNISLAKFLSRLHFKFNITDTIFAVILSIVQFAWLLGYMQALYNLARSKDISENSSSNDFDLELGMPTFLRSANRLSNVVNASAILSKAGEPTEEIRGNQLVKCGKCGELVCKLEDLQANQICGLKTRPNAKPCTGKLGSVNRYGKVIAFYLWNPLSFLDQLNVLFQSEEIWNELDVMREYRLKYNTLHNSPGEKFPGLHPVQTPLREAFSKACQVEDSNGVLRDFFDPVHCPYNVALTYSMDAAQMKDDNAQKNKISPGTIVISDLEGSLRFSDNYRMNVGFVNGPDKGQTYNSLNELLVEELLYSYRGFFKQIDPRTGTEHIIRAAVTLFPLDNPARCKCGGFMGQQNEFGCNGCTFPSERFEDGTKKDGSVYSAHTWYTPPEAAKNISMYARKEEENYEQSQKFKNATTVCAANDLSKSSGLRYTVWDKLPYFSLTKMMPGDPMHLIEGEVDKLYNL